MKKSKRTQLTALMFAAATAGMTATGCAQNSPPDSDACPGTETVTATVAPAQGTLTANSSVLAMRASGIAGDADGNSTIDRNDIKRLQKYLLGGSSKKLTADADINGDGEIDVFDLAMIKRTVSELETQHPTEPTEETEETEETTLMTEPLYGPPEWFTTTTEEPTETTIETLYGPPWVFTKPDETTIESLEPTSEPQDVYGPPEWFTDPTEETLETQDPSEILPQPEYGAPVFEDMTEPTTDIPTDETTFQPVYGTPPVLDN